MSAALFIEATGTEVGDEQVAKDLVRWALAMAGANNAERVTRIGVRIGPDALVTPEDLEHAIQLVTRCTIAEGADIQVRESDRPGAVVETIGLQ